MRRHWSNCITHFDEEVMEFVSSYFGQGNCHCLLVSAAGFDPRSKRVSEILANAMGDRVEGLFIREERGRPSANLITAADENEQALRRLMPKCNVVNVDIFAEDGAAIGGSRIASLIDDFQISDHITDIVLDMSALSIGIGFPAAKLLLQNCESTSGRSFHLMTISNPELDERIFSEPADRPMAIKGFSGINHLTGTMEVAKIWLPQLSKGKVTMLGRIGLSIGECYKICPVLPFPARDPRRADSLITEYETQLVNEWQVDPRDIVYVSERNPLDCFRTISTLKARYDMTVEGTFEPQIILSPIGSKVMAVGALMAAIEYDLTVQYMEAVRYELDTADENEHSQPDMLIHVLLSGPAYGDYGSVTQIDGE